MGRFWPKATRRSSSKATSISPHPRSIIQAHFKPSDHHRVCSWKGLASYHHVEVDGKRNSNAAWYYPDPSQAADKIKGYVGFWHGVQVVPAGEREVARSED